MEQSSRGSLDDPAFRGRMRATRNAAAYGRQSASRTLDGFPVRQPAKAVAAKPVQHQVAAPMPTAQAARPVVHKPHPVTVKPQPHLPKQSRSHVLKRQMVKSASKKYRPKHRRPLMPTLLSAMAILLFTVGLLVVFSTLRTDHTVKAQVKQLAKQSDDDTTDGVPSEDNPPKNIGSYKVAPDLPRLLTIEKIGVNARVIRVGVNASGAMKTPSNIFDVAWYDGSAKPGDPGTVVIDGHVSGPTQHGVFYSIRTLKAGDKVKIERGDGKVFSYTVTGTQIYDDDKVDMEKVMTSSVPGKSGLNFMTCTGRFNVRSNSFEQRVVVFSVQD